MLQSGSESVALQMMLDRLNPFRCLQVCRTNTEPGEDFCVCVSQVVLICGDYSACSKLSLLRLGNGSRLIKKVDI